MPNTRKTQHLVPEFSGPYSEGQLNCPDYCKPGLLSLSSCKETTRLPLLTAIPVS